MAIPVVGNQDLFNAQGNLNARTATTLGEMQRITEESVGKKGDELQQLQMQLAQLQRDLDILKQMEEKLAKAMESLSKFIQPQ